jgi:hypothetical protein
LARIADAYELITSIHDDPNMRRAAAFVAGTTQQILAQEKLGGSDVRIGPILDRDGVDPVLTAAILFLAAEQYADANEAARQISVQGRQPDFVATLLAEDIRDLASGNLSGILERAQRRPEHFVSHSGLEVRGTTALFESILVGVELFAAEGACGGQVRHRPLGLLSRSGVIYQSV